MAIFDISAVSQKVKQETANLKCAAVQEGSVADEMRASLRDRFFSSLTTRLFFFVLLIADVCWGAYSLVLLIVNMVLSGVTMRKVPYFLKKCGERWLSFKRSLICGLSLITAFFSPSFGIMVACTYFLIYDKSGIEEVVPMSLQDQFKEFFKSPSASC